MISMLTSAVCLLVAASQVLTSGVPTTVQYTTGSGNGLQVALPIVVTPAGQTIQGMSGSTLGTRIHKYLGIPYARPPVGSRRFQAPEPLKASRGDLDATQLKPACVQHQHMANLMSPLINVDTANKVSEDCLYLNVYAPAKNLTSDSLMSEQYPVVVFFAGEGFDYADARQFDGSNMAALMRSIVVTVQYRVGAFGFLKASGIAAGNMGLLDQVEALRWVQANVEAFGGDRSRVTIMGRLSGAMSVSILATNPTLWSADEVLFEKAILMSGIAAGQWTFESKPEERAAELMKSLNCATAECLKSTNAEDLLKAAGWGWRPVVDGVKIMDEPLAALRSDRGLAKGLEQIVLGSTANEGSLCLMAHQAMQSPYWKKLQDNSLTEPELLDMMEADSAMYHGSVEHITTKSAQDYTPIGKSSQEDVESETSLRDTYVRFCSSLLIGANIDRFASLVKKSKPSVSLYRYVFEERPSFSPAADFLKGGAHGDDVLVAFGLAYSAPSTTMDDLSLTRDFIGYLGNFIHSGSPYQGQLSSMSATPRWCLVEPLEDSQGANTLHIKSSSHCISHMGAEPLQLQDSRSQKTSSASSATPSEVHRSEEHSLIHLLICGGSIASFLALCFVTFMVILIRKQGEAVTETIIRSYSISKPRRGAAHAVLNSARLIAARNQASRLRHLATSRPNQ